LGRHRRFLAVLAVVPVVLITAPAEGRGRCVAPSADGWRSCLQARFAVPHGGGGRRGVRVLRLSATLLRRVGHCPHRTAPRTVTVVHATRAVASGQADGRCRSDRHGAVVRWSLSFGARDAAAWPLTPGAPMASEWSDALTAVVTVPG
jgi:hypothetical protein